ncbi:LLM class flavin-dependent oxidoreductase [Nocardia sp. CA-290969]|uniref:LLM class flavin-dependent oxidoreductase n=1 Tax=Nocardia sp. CA-290969 TaxID=3239986 RepID=UPI003D8CF29F
MSHGRAGWNAVTTSDPHVAANYGKAVAERDHRYRRARETIQIAQALWGSRQRDAWIKDRQSDRFIDRPSSSRSTSKASTWPPTDRCPFRRRNKGSG